MLNKKGFSKPPLSKQERERKANEIIAGAAITTKIEDDTALDNGKIKTIYIRAPESYYRDLREIMSKTRLSMNAICLELLRPAIKARLKEINEE
jgi:hypothetical protein